MTVVVLRPRAIKGLNRTSGEEQVAIKSAIQILEQGSIPLHTRKLGGSPHGYRTRVGKWRILFTLENSVADIADIFIKKERGDYRRRT